MGTRSLTHFKTETGKTICTIYRQYDGYPTGHGADIKRVLGDRTLVNGYSYPDQEANGIGCAAALMIADLKKDMLAGNIYIESPNAKDMFEDFTYYIKAHGDTFKLTVVEQYDETPKTIYDGPIRDFDPKSLEEAA